MREIILDTETTGFDPQNGDKIVEISAIELVNGKPTGKAYHQYINPQKHIPEEVSRLIGLSDDFLKNFPIFTEIADNFLDFIKDATLVIHNSIFDLNFINHELKQINKEEISQDKVIDTFITAIELFPNEKNNLDALCKRFNISTNKRSNHAVSLYCELSCLVYMKLNDKK